MLLTNSDVAKEMRGVMIDITMDTIAKKTGGHTKYINQRDKDYLNKAYIEEAERKKFTDALKEYVGVGQYKYAYFTDLLYKSQTIEFVSLHFLLNFSSSHFEINATLLIVTSYTILRHRLRYQHLTRTHRNLVSK